MSFLSKRKSEAAITVSEECYRELFRDGADTLLSAEIHYCVFKGVPKRAVERINNYYSRMRKLTLRCCKVKLMPLLLKQKKEALERGEAFLPVIVTLRSRICFNDKGLLSLFTDMTNSAEIWPPLKRFGDVWSLSNGCPVMLESFFPKGCNWKKKLRGFAVSEARRGIDESSSIYFQNYEKLLSKHLSAVNFYITQSGLVFFYPYKSVAPPVEGIPCFTCRWSEDGPCCPET